MHPLNVSITIIPCGAVVRVAIHVLVYCWACVMCMYILIFVIMFLIFTHINVKHTKLITCTIFKIFQEPQSWSVIKYFPSLLTRVDVQFICHVYKSNVRIQNLAQHSLTTFKQFWTDLHLKLTSLLDNKNLYLVTPHTHDATYIST